MTGAAIMIRNMSFLALAALVLAGAAAAQAADTVSGSPALKAAATVAGEIVRIGDLVDNAGAVAEVPIFRAPDLGETGSVPVVRVIDALRGHHLIGLDTRGLSEVAVTRAARAITAKEIEANVLRVLAGRYGLPDPDNLAIVFDNEVRTVEVEATATRELAVRRLTYEPRTNRFDVTFELPESAAARRLALHFTGTLTETSETVVPAHDIAQGHLLSASDLAIERRPRSQLTAAVTGIDQAQGLSAKHLLKAGQIIRQPDVTKPELVGRNETVTIVYEVPGILLTMAGKAVEPGALGDVINVLNAQSKRTLQATVIGPGRVTVASPASRLAANTAP
jgi:flagella basal body P-ring formation protein FlgA